MRIKFFTDDNKLQHVSCDYLKLSADQLTHQVDDVDTDFQNSADELMELRGFNNVDSPSLENSEAMLRMLIDFFNEIEL